MTHFEKIKNMDIEDMAIYHTILIYDHLNRLVKELDIDVVKHTKEEMKLAVQSWKKLLESEV